MRAQVLGTILMVVPVFAIARQSAAPVAQPSPKLFTASSDVVAMMAKAKAERKPDQANFVQPIVQLAPYNANPARNASARCQPRWRTAASGNPLAKAPKAPSSVPPKL